MNADEARRLLGVGVDADADGVRAAYRSRIRAVHPDHHAGDERDIAAATAAAAALNEAFRVLRAERDPVPTPPHASTATPPRRDIGEPSVAVLRPDGDSLAVAAPAGDVFVWLLAALHAVGEVTYIDAESGLLEAVVEEASGNRTSVLLSLQGRAEATEAFCSAERLSGADAVDLPGIVDRLVDALVGG